ncbi:40968_t:CDS:1 [Gigaspora margarita]|uniref:40968_t:CDS:1 n=1 Tax=Gigaspora margarita TaxID=4874 RepID=A0ABN7VVN2_GIGMA|nr:40968_t:CDS:1 [Gigaspora margarita]
MSFFKKFVNKLKKRNTLTSEETFVNTWKEESKFKKFFKKLFKKNEEEEVIEENFWGWNKNENDYSSYSASIDKDSFKSLLIQTEDEKQSGFDCLETSEYLVFINFESFQNYLYNNKIIESGQMYYNSKNKRLKSILGFLDAHIGSYYNMYYDGEKFFKENNTFDLREHRSKGYENDFRIWFNEMNLYCEQFKVKYIWTFTDLEYYFKNNIAFKYGV